MIDRTPTPRAERPALPAFEAVPRRNARHDGWTPPRQVAFIEALADTGSVKSAAAQVNMSSESAYALRRAPGAAGFARAWAAALDMGVLRLKDEAFERALHGELVPVIAGGRLHGYRRKRSDRLLIFLLRHYGEGSAGARVPADALRPPSQRRARAAGIAEAAAAAPEPSPPALAAPAQPLADESIAAETVAAFAGVPLDEEAQAQIAAVLEACAARARAADPADDPDQTHVDGDLPEGHPDAVVTPDVDWEDHVDRRPGDEDWRTLDLPDQRPAIEAAVAAIKAKKASGEWARDRAAAQAEWEATEPERAKAARLTTLLASGRPLEEWSG